MKTIVIYDSRFGNTKQIAESIAKGCAKHEVILKYINDVEMKDLEKIQLLILGSPINGGRCTKPVQEFIDKIEPNALMGIKAATFDTGTPIENQGFVVNNITKLFGRAAPRIAQSLNEKGAEIIKSETFIVLDYEGPLQDGELERAREWANEL